MALSKSMIPLVYGADWNGGKPTGRYFGEKAKLRILKGRSRRNRKPGWLARLFCVELDAVTSQRGATGAVHSQRPVIAFGPEL